MEKIAVSVIIPVFNAEKYLRECLDSVIAQTLSNIEIICVDDGSTDASLQILNDYKCRDNRVKIIHKANSGYGNTMNIGNSEAVGEYLAILESDDYIDRNMYEDLYKCAKENELDFVKANYYCFWDKEGDRYFKPFSLVVDKSIYDRVLSRKEIKELFRGNIGHWSGLYKKEFLDRYRIRYNETSGASYQDVGFHFQAMMYAERGYVKSDSYYRYRQDNPNSSVLNKEKVFCICDEHQFIYDILKSNKELFFEYNDVFQVVKYANYVFAFNRIADKYKKGFAKKIQEDYKYSINNAEMDWSRLTSTEIENIKAIISRGNQIVDDYLLKVKKLYEKIQNYEEIVIYGAGVKAKEILDLLNGYWGTFKNVYFAVSEMKDDNLIYYGYLVKSIYEFADKKDEVAVLIGVSDKYREELLEVVRTLDFKNIVLPE